MTYSELVSLYFERSNALQWYWTLYVVVIGGLLAFASVRQRPDLVTTVLVSVLYGLFAWKNLGAIGDVTAQRLVILEAIRHQPATGVLPGLEPTLIAPTYESVRNFHLLSDVLTVAALWAMEIRRRRAATART